eukprot:1195535-Prorocentrum_minimum.AAC.1
MNWKIGSTYEPKQCSLIHLQSKTTLLTNTYTYMHTTCQTLNPKSLKLVSKIVSASERVGCTAVSLSLGDICRSILGLDTDMRRP